MRSPRSGISNNAHRCAIQGLQSRQLRNQVNPILELPLESACIWSPRFVCRIPRHQLLSQRKLEYPQTRTEQYLQVVYTLPVLNSGVVHDYGV